MSRLRLATGLAFIFDGLLLILRLSDPLLWIGVPVAIIGLAILARR